MFQRVERTSAKTTNENENTTRSRKKRNRNGGGGGGAWSSFLSRKNSNNNNNNSQTSTGSILRGVVVCLTGLDPQEKEHYHGLVEKMGGTFTRDLNLENTTHLIALEAQGEKYNVAASSCSIHIVKPSWLEASLKTGERAQEQLHSLLPVLLSNHHSHSQDHTMNGDASSSFIHNKEQQQRAGISASGSSAPLLAERIQQLLSSTTRALPTTTTTTSRNDDASVLFSACNFYLVGFETTDKDSSTKDNDDNDDDDDTKKDEHLQLLLGRLVRRGLGTIYWDFFSEIITHVIVKDQAPKAIGDAARSIALQFPNNCPFFVSPWWIVDSLACGTIKEEADYPALYRSLPLPDDDDDDNESYKKRKTERMAATVSSKHNNIKRAPPASLPIFKGSVFCLLGVSPPPWAVDFDARELETSIRAHGGQLISLKLVEAMKVDNADNNNVNNNKASIRKDATSMTTNNNKRKCFVVGWGGYLPCHMDIHPLMSQVKRHALCDIQQVTPIWLQTCFSEQKVVPPSRLPALFCSSSSRLIYSLSPTAASAERTPKAMGGGGKKRKKLTTAEVGSIPAIRISVTGFSGSKRTAIMHMIKAMGATYDDSMRTSTTHLICKEGCPTGKKYEKAVEWGLKIVSLDWLYHVAQFGYKGEQNKKGARKEEEDDDGDDDDGTRGCEALFPINASLESSSSSSALEL